MKPCIVVTGGGTGGHVFPALAVVEELSRQMDARLVWIGGSTGMERAIVRRWGMEFWGIPTGKLRRYLSFSNLWDLFKTAAGILRSLVYLMRLRPVLVFSKGGFVSVPPVVAAGLLGIPVVSHESDYDPGLATRINARFSKRICVAYPESLRFFRKGQAVVTGNPVRAEILAGDAAEGKRIAGFSESDRRPVLLVVGGSLGARQLNALVKDNLRAVLAKWRVIHQRGAGEWDLEDIPGSYFCRPFFSAEYPHLLAAADLVLSRAGAGSVWEMGVRAKPGILVPLSAGSRGDQLRNAEHCRKQGAVVVFRPEDYAATDLGNLDLRETLNELANDKSRRERMSAAWAGIVRDGAARNCTGVIMSVLDRPLKRGAAE